MLVLDEPSNGLDPAGIAWLRRFLKDLPRTGHTMLISSHALSEVQQIADRVVIVDQGRLVREGRLDELTVASRVHVQSPDAERFALVVESAGATVRRGSADVLELHRLRKGGGRLALEHGSSCAETARTGSSRLLAHRVGRPMTALVLAEFRKLTTTRLWL